MPHPRLTERQIGELVGWIGGYIAEQGSAFHDRARPIKADDERTLQSFFPADVLDAVRVVRGRAAEPAFYSQLRAMGIRNAPPFSEMAGVTFQDVVVHVELLTRSLLFHE